MDADITKMNFLDWQKSKNFCPPNEKLWDVLLNLNKYVSESVLVDYITEWIKDTHYKLIEHCTVIFTRPNKDRYVLYIFEKASYDWVHSIGFNLIISNGGDHTKQEEYVIRYNELIEPNPIKIEPDDIPVYMQYAKKLIDNRRESLKNLKN